jgi:hypothetical protein
VVRSFWLGMGLTVVCSLVLLAGFWWLLSALGDNPITLTVVSSTGLAICLYAVWRELRGER